MSARGAQVVGLDVNATSEDVLEHGDAIRHHEIAYALLRVLPRERLCAARR